MSIKYKIALLFAGLVMLLMAVVSLSIYFFSQEERTNTFQTRLKNRAMSTAKVYAGISNGDFTVLQNMDTAAVASLFSKSITISNADSSRDYMFSDEKNDPLILERKIIEKTKQENEYYFTYHNKAAVALHYIYKDKDFYVGVSAADVDGREYLEQLKRILTIAIIVAAILSFFAGLLFAKNLIQPITRISGEVKLISSNNISQRIKISGTKDELTDLAQTFNQLLDRLQDSFTIQRRFISNASHELSTPLTSVSSQLEVAMQKKRSEEEYESVIKSVYEDIKVLQQLTKSLLDIAKTGSQGGIDLSEVRIDEILLKVIADVQKQNTDFKITFDFENFPDEEGLLSAFGNANLLYIAFKNIIENGCKYSENHLSRVIAFFNQKEINIRVMNNGDVIAESDIQNIFQPFFRTESAQNKPGFGLGLTLTKRILALHKGTIEVNSDFEKGTEFSVTIPNIGSGF